MSAPELKPCPWCNGTNLKCDPRYVWCDDCTSYGPTALYPDTPANTWNTRADIAPTPLPAPDRVGIWACHTNSNGSVWVVPVEGAKPVQLRSDFDEGIERWYWLSEPDTQEQSND